MTSKSQLPLLVINDLVLFPGTTIPIFINKALSINALKACKTIGAGQHILCTSSKKSTNNHKLSDLYKIGTIAKIIQTIKLPNDNFKIILEIEQRVALTIHKNKEYFYAEFESLPDEPIDSLQEIEMLAEDLSFRFHEYVKLNKKINPDILQVISDNKNPTYITNIIASHVLSGHESKQKLLSITSQSEKILTLIEILDNEITLLETELFFQSQVKKHIEKTQRDYFLNEQMKVIQKELNVDDKTEILEFEKKIQSLKLSKEAKDKAEIELKKLKSMNPMSSESSIVRNYLELLLSMPWGHEDSTKINITKATKILDQDHYGLEKIKERILEYLAVLQRSKSLTSPIICFVGPPGVGKTSLVKSIADALGRKYAKIALGGVHDESEIRGHRRTYLGSMPGKIISAIKKSKTDNPVILLDEIDKMSHDFRGDPAAALLEVLDPEQNKFFADHYLEVEYDLSKVLFVATANSYNLPRPLLDRLEIIKVSGYIEDEKIQIAQNHLVPKQFTNHNMKKDELNITTEAMLDIIRYYTKESGVRNLEREIGSIVRKTLKILLSDKSISAITVTPNDLEKYLGPKKYNITSVNEEDQVGVCKGLAYTEVGGELLTIEAIFVPGSGKIRATGKLGDVMKESTEAAFSLVQSRAESLGVDLTQYEKKDVHLHVPEGATPKDGPSAGITIFTTLVSLFLGRPIDKTIAMTGEVTLRGNVLRIGGLKEKLLAAKRGGIKTVIIPKDNEPDLQEIPKVILDELKIIPIANVNNLIDYAIVK